MKVNKWTAALASAGVIGGVTAAQAEESPVMTALASTTISGFVDVAAHWIPDNQNDDGFATLPIYSRFAGNKSDGFNLNVVNLQIGKGLDESQWAAGYKVELLFGPDAVGYNASINNVANSDFGIKQAYVELQAPLGSGLNLKFGVFDTIIGYEYANNNANPNYTRSWGWSVEPTQHTGLLASYEVADYITVMGGIANTLSAGINTRDESEDDKAAMGAIAITAPESWGFLEGATLYGGAVYGINAHLVGNDQANYYAGVTIPTGNEKISVGLAYDYVNVNNPGGAHQNVYGVYGSFQATEKFGVHLRGEYADGNFISTTATGEEAEIWSLTATLQYDLWANVISRLEFRYDNVEDAPFAFGTEEDENILVALNVIYTF
jgi:hypothetical protein